MIKYASNAFLATKISFMNEMANLCELLDVDVSQVAADGMGYNRRIGRSFLNAGIGYGGSCFPKDTDALTYLAKDNGYEFQILEAVKRVNSIQPFSVITKIKKHLESLRGKNITILGLAFKPNIDDVSEAPSIKIIEKLLKDGASITAYDPVAMDNVKKHFPYSITFATDVNEALKDADAAIIVTEWEEFINLDLNYAKTIMKQPLLIDGRNCLNSNVLKSYGFTYESIGRREQIQEERSFVLSK